jgi:hypothetical protein
VHVPEEEADGRGVGDVGGRCGASAASEEAADASKAVNDDRTRVTEKAPDLESNGKMAHSLDVLTLSPS